MGKYQICGLIGILPESREYGVQCTTSSINHLSYNHVILSAKHSLCLIRSIAYVQFPVLFSEPIFTRSATKA